MKDKLRTEEQKEKNRECVRKHYKKKMKEDPDWSARRQREYRKNNPSKFNFIMARFYYRKLTPEQKERLND